MFQVDDLDLRPITNPADFPVVVHGTNEKAYTLIQTQVGLPNSNVSFIIFIYMQLIRPAQLVNHNIRQSIAEVLIQL